jgi:tRNA-specific adenosine deaminase 3
VDSLPENAYLCSGFDLYLTHEPDLMSSMALVHSRIRRVFFRNADGSTGALLSGRGHIHCLRSLNHNYRVFQMIKCDDSS